MSAVSLSGARILVTGPTGQVAKPLSLALAKDATVFGLARFTNQAAKAELEAGGAERCAALVHEAIAHYSRRGLIS